jgi:hypothetical protein
MKFKGWKVPHILVFSTPMNRENLSEFGTEKQLEKDANVSVTTK